jgi:alcohol dehydrogenase
MGAGLAGCHPIVAVDVLPAKLDLARTLGATDGVLASDAEAADRIRTLTGGGGEIVVEAVGRVRSLELAYAVTRRGGTTVATGLPAPDQQLTLPALSLVAEERTLKGSYMGSAVPRRDVPRLLALAEADRLPLRALVSGTISLSDINEGFDRLADASVVRQLVTFG